MKFYIVFNVRIVRKTPNVLSSIFVLKYQLHAQVDIFLDKSKDIRTFIKCADVWEIACFDVSKAQIFQGLFGY